jgi:hypothetical protein
MGIKIAGIVLLLFPAANSNKRKSKCQAVESFTTYFFIEVMF